MKARRLLGILLAGALLAGCASVPVERSRRPLASGSGSYLLSRKYRPDREGGRYIYFTRFYFGSSGFYRSEIFTIRKVEGEGAGRYQLIIDLNGPELSNIRSIVIKADGSVYRLSDPKYWSNWLPFTALRFEERYQFQLDPALVASLRTAKTIRIQDVAGPITLTPRQRSALQSFLRDTETSVYF
jgi:hypothetical protein